MKTAREILLKNAPVFQQDSFDSELKHACIAAMEEYANQSKWISVKDRLPEIGQPYDAWLATNTRVADCGPYIGPWNEDFRRECMLIKGITHWRPIPEGPKKA